MLVMLLADQVIKKLCVVVLAQLVQSLGGEGEFESDHPPALLKSGLLPVAGLCQVGLMVFVCVHFLRCSSMLLIVALRQRQLPGCPLIALVESLANNLLFARAIVKSANLFVLLLVMIIDRHSHLALITILLRR